MFGVDLDAAARAEAAREIALRPSALRRAGVGACVAGAGARARRQPASWHRAFARPHRRPARLCRGDARRLPGDARWAGAGRRRRRFAHHRDAARRAVERYLGAVGHAGQCLVQPADENHQALQNLVSPSANLPSRAAENLYLVRPLWRALRCQRAAAAGGHRRGARRATRRGRCHWRRRSLLAQPLRADRFGEEEIGLQLLRAATHPERGNEPAAAPAVAVRLQPARPHVRGQLAQPERAGRRSDLSAWA